MTGQDLGHPSRLLLDNDMDYPVARPEVDKRMRMHRKGQNRRDFGNKADKYVANYTTIYLVDGCHRLDQK